jgi:hypothetical protein
MKPLTKQNKGRPARFARFGKIATVLAVGGLLCVSTYSSVLAAYHGHGHAVRRVYHRVVHSWRGGHWGGGYYAPGPEYYVAPEPYSYYVPGPCYGPYDESDCGPPPPSGISLFFGL